MSTQKSNEPCNNQDIIDKEAKIKQKISSRKGDETNRLTLSEKSNTLKLIRDQDPDVVCIDSTFETIFPASLGIKVSTVKVEEQNETVSYTIPDKIKWGKKGLIKVYIDEVTLYRKNNLYTLITTLGGVRDKFISIENLITYENSKGLLKNYKVDYQEVLKDLLRMNGFDELLKEFDLIKINIRPRSTRSDEIILYAQLDEKHLIVDSIIDIIVEFSKVVEIYKHFFHYILKVDELKDNNSNVFNGIKDSAIFCSQLHNKERNRKRNILKSKYK